MNFENAGSIHHGHTAWVYGGMRLIIHVVGADVPLTFDNVHEESVKVKDGALIWEHHPSRGNTCFGIPVERVLYWESEAGEV